MTAKTYLYIGLMVVVLSSVTTFIVVSVSFDRLLEASDLGDRQVAYELRTPTERDPSITRSEMNITEDEIEERLAERPDLEERYQEISERLATLQTQIDEANEAGEDIPREIGFLQEDLEEELASIILSVTSDVE